MTKKLFVLDTSVIIYDYDAIKNFEEHDIAIPITVLEELDNLKKGNDTKNFSAREFSRFLDQASGKQSLQEWIPIDGKNKGEFTIVMNELKTSVDAIEIFGDDKGDHRILNAALYLKAEYPKRQVIMVSKDINLRIKAKSLDITAEDYETGKLKDSEIQADTVPTGRSVIENVDTSLIDELYTKEEVENTGVVDKNVNSNQFFVLKNGKKSALSFFNKEKNALSRVEKINCFGIKPKNAEQAFAMDALTNPDVKLISIQGVAGTGKTLLSLATALAQHHDYHHIFLARPVVPLSNKDIGYLPGDAGQKLNPYMEPLWDNLSFIKNQFSFDNREYLEIEEMQRMEKIVVCPLAYIRGRSLSNVFFIIDEAQNLTPHEIKTIISRAGENTKIVFTGDVFQIDTPYLDTYSNGLSYLIERAKEHPLYAHVALEKGERSDLANLANDLL
ncbi:MAG: ribonuclease [Flavobacteriales bacterium]|nr:ribonuclease [Flavobacteriales bacterium]|tara:strand:+ start:8210 stop:9544 length:1335 start_codon:yes stop_codon:yes gene_type:complete